MKNGALRSKVFLKKKYPETPCIGRKRPRPWENTKKKVIYNKTIRSWKIDKENAWACVVKTCFMQLATYMPIVMTTDKAMKKGTELKIKKKLA